MKMIFVYSGKLSLVNRLLVCHCAVKVTTDVDDDDDDVVVMRYQTCPVKHSAAEPHPDL